MKLYFFPFSKVMANRKLMKIKDPRFPDIEDARVDVLKLGGEAFCRKVAEILGRDGFTWGQYKRVQKVGRSPQVNVAEACALAAGLKGWKIRVSLLARAIQATGEAQPATRE